ncbi:MAG: NINE protein [Polyangiaceae bacterium]|nr:NINE protein [Polyangiaceae bacterium]
MLMMNQPGAQLPSLPVVPPVQSVPSFTAEAPPMGAAPGGMAGAPLAGAPLAGAMGIPATGAAPGKPSRIKGTIVGVAPQIAPNLGGMPFGTMPMPAVAVAPVAAPGLAPAAPVPVAEEVPNPLAPTMAIDLSGGVPPYNPFEPAAAFGEREPHAGAAGAGMYGGGGAPQDAGPGAMYSGGAPPPQADNLYGAPPAYSPQANLYATPHDWSTPAPVQQPPYYDFGNQPNQAMQPYAGGAPIMPGMPGAAQIPGVDAPNAIAARSDRSRMVALVLCFFFGWLGAHRWYTRRYVTAAIQTITLGGLGIWILIDFIMLFTHKFTDSRGRPLLH